MEGGLIGQERCGALAFTLHKKIWRKKGGRLAAALY